VANLEFDIQKLTKASSDIDQASQDLAGLQSAMQTVNSDLGASWAGNARSTFVGVFSEFEQIYAKANAALNALGENVATARNQLGVSDQNVGSSSSKLKGSLNINIPTT
jgi:WXG100 family type VII secretion target